MEIFIGSFMGGLFGVLFGFGFIIHLIQSNPSVKKEIIDAQKTLEDD